MVGPDPLFDALMTLLCELHDRRIILDPAISTKREELGIAVTVEFILPVASGGPEQSEET